MNREQYLSKRLRAKLQAELDQESLAGVDDGFASMSESGENLPLTEEDVSKSQEGGDPEINSGTR